MSFKKRVNFEAERTLAFGSIGAAYVSIPPAFSEPIRLLRIGNTTDASLVFSFDGTTDQITLGSNDSILLNTQQFSSLDEEAVFPENTIVFVKQLAGAPTMGTVIINTGFVS